MIATHFMVIVAIASGVADPTRRDECQYLNIHFDTDGFASHVRAKDGCFDGERAFLADRLPADQRAMVWSARFGSIPFLRPRTDGDRNNMVACRGQVIRVRTQRIFNVLFSLGSAHDGHQFDWIEFQFEDGTKARGPFGFSDWRGEPILGEEIAFRLGVTGLNPPMGGVCLWFQRTPIPVQKRIVAMRLPETPEAKVMGLTLGWRDGVSSIERATGKPEEALVAIFSEHCFPSHGSQGDLTPAKLRTAFARVSIPAAFLHIEHLKDPAVLHPEAYPVLVQPAGDAFPLEAEANLRAYRKRGGAMIHTAVPFTIPVIRTPYGGWHPLGSTSEFGAHEGPRGMGCGAGAAIGAMPANLVPAPELASWGLGEVQWDRFLPRGYGRHLNSSFEPKVLSRQSLHPDDEVVPLLSSESSPHDLHTAIVRHRTCTFRGCIDLWCGSICEGSEPLPIPVDLLAEMIVRGAARILSEKGHLTPERWKEISRPVPEGLRRPERLDPLPPDPAWGWHLPRGPRAGRRMGWVDVSGIADSERVLLASAQGLINRSECGESIYLVERPKYFMGGGQWSEDDTEQSRLRWYERERLVESLHKTDTGGVLERLGHRRAVVVDPETWGSLNVASMLAAVEGLLIAYPADVAKYDLEVVADLRGRFRSAAEGYAWALETLWPRLNHRCIGMVEPGIHTYAVRDYLIAQKIFVFWIPAGHQLAIPGASRSEAEAFAARLFAKTPVCMPVLGTGGDLVGPAEIEFLSRFGKHFVRADRLGNLSYTSGLEADLVALPAPVLATPMLDLGKVYVARGYRENLTGIHRVAYPWNRWGIGSDLGGHVFPASAADLFPAHLIRVFKELSPRECIGSTGLGEVDPDAFGGAYGESAEGVRELYWKLTDQSMRALGQRFILLEHWRKARSGGIADCARTVSSAEIILLAYRPFTDLNPTSACYMLHGRPVVHSLFPGGFPDLQTEKFMRGPYATTRPAFAWMEFFSGQVRPGIHSPDAVLVNPIELAVLYRAYVTAVGSK